MFDFFNQLLGFVEVTFSFFMNVIESLIQAITFVVTSVPFVFALASYMPAIIASCMIIIVSIAIVKFIIGR